MTSFIDFEQELLSDFVSGETIKEACPAFWKPTGYDHSVSTKITDRSTVFCKTESALNEYFDIVRRKPELVVNVVTHNSDVLIGENIAKLKPTNVNRWFAINSIHPDPSITPIPLGLANSYCPITNKIEDIKSINTAKSRQKLLYVNHRTHTFPQERAPLLGMFINKEAKGERWFTIAENCKRPHDEMGARHKATIRSFLEEMVEHKFVLCPRGNGVDTHRIWEALYSRTIPVVRYEAAYRNFTDLPILFVDDWRVLNENFLENQYELMSKRKWNYNKLRTSWWKDEINSWDK